MVSQMAFDIEVRLKVTGHDQLDAVPEQNLTNGGCVSIALGKGAKPTFASSKGYTSLISLARRSVVRV